MSSLVRDPHCNVLATHLGVTTEAALAAKSEGCQPNYFGLGLRLGLRPGHTATEKRETRNEKRETRNRTELMSVLQVPHQALPGDPLLGVADVCVTGPSSSSSRRSTIGSG